VLHYSNLDIDVVAINPLNSRTSTSPKPVRRGNFELNQLKKHMETQTLNDSRLQALLYLYDLHTNYFGNAIDGISDSDAQKRLDTKANHIAWITGSLVEERFDLARNFGVEGQQSANELFKNYQGIQDGVTYPSLIEFKKDWDKITPLLKDALYEASTEKLDTSFEMMPGYRITYYELVAFMTHREAYLIGQIGLWRRLLGYPAMKYQ